LTGPVERPPFVRYLKARAEDYQEFKPTSAPRKSFGRDRLQKNLEGHGAPGRASDKEVEQQTSTASHMEAQVRGNDQFETRPACGVQPAQSVS
jgi:hypothetical protein